MVLEQTAFKPKTSQCFTDPNKPIVEKSITLLQLNPQ